MFFKKSQSIKNEVVDLTTVDELTTDEKAELAREAAIDYIASLGKADKDNFIAGAELIWQGYNQMTTVKTRLQREIQREANRKAGVANESADDDAFGFLES